VSKPTSLLEFVSHQLSKVGCAREEMAAAATCLSSVFPKQRVLLKRHEKISVSHEARRTANVIMIYG